MQQRISTPTLLIIALVGCALVFSYSVVLEGAGQEVSPPFKQEKVRLPVRLKIPTINVDAAVEHVGLTPLGVMDVPKDITNVAWYELGPRPGEEGSAVIAGHFGWKDGKVSAFDNLSELRKGEKIYVTDEKGVVVVFVVRDIQMYRENQYASGVFDSMDGKAHLNLVTCEGVWNKTSKSYSNRLIVFADKEGE